MNALAFQINDFRSIKDSGECTLSGDGITVLAGQNEAGKSAILMALRDFDLAEGKPPITTEYLPEGKQDARPLVSVLFNVNVDQINTELATKKLVLPDAVYTHLKTEGKLWITRDLLSGKFLVRKEMADLWSRSPTPQPPQTPSEAAAAHTPLTLDKLGENLWRLWPNFVFFDSFTDELPRKIAVDPLCQVLNPSLPQPVKQPGQSSVEDFLQLADIDLARVVQLKDDDKGLGNYLNGRTATITGDFLTYWKQFVDGEQKVKLQVRHARNPQGQLQFAFYVHDGVDQYPEQRSRGFLWFLSFYLKLAAQEARDPGKTRLILVDEPGTYLHAKAQKDVLHVIEDKLAKKQRVVYSTHSPYLIPVDKLHRLRIALRRGNQGTIVVDRLTHPALRSSTASDTLSPIITAIGLDIRERLGGLTKRNLLVEGFSDHIYISAWCAQLHSSLHGDVCIFPGTGAGSLPTLGSFCIGWGLEFSVLLDRDQNGDTTANKFERELGLNASRIIRPSNAVAIEDVFELEDFKMLLKTLDPSLTVNSDETPSKAMKRQKVDKILLARKFAENPSVFTKSVPSFSRLLKEIEKSFQLS